MVPTTDDVTIKRIIWADELGDFLDQSSLPEAQALSDELPG